MGENTRSDDSSVPGNQAPPRRQFHIRHVDGLRAVAVLSVLAFHLRPQWVPGGFVGVDVFFAISGFVVTASLARHRGESLWQFIGGFYRRRLTRIMPALIVVLLATALLYVLLIPRSWLGETTGRVAWLAFFGLSNFSLQYETEAYFSPRAEFNPFTHTWSLGVEEQFYLVAPWLLYLHVFGRRAAGSGGRHPWAIVLLAVISLACMIAWTREAPLAAFYHVASRFWELAAGALWYIVFWDEPRPANARIGQVFALAGVALVASSLALASAESFPFPWALAAVAGSLLLIGLPSGAPVARIALGNGPMVWIGLRSYSLYLWHWPVLVLLRWTVGLDTPGALLAAVVLSFGLASASFRWIEIPTRGNRTWAALRAPVAIAVALVLTAASALVTQQLFDRRDDLGRSTVSRGRLDWYLTQTDPTLTPADMNCRSPLATRTVGGGIAIEYRTTGCNASADLQGRTMFVLGDSHAAAYLPMLHRLAARSGMNAIVYQAPGCPFLDLIAPMGIGRPAECVIEARAARADVLAQAKAGDVVFLPTLRLRRFVDQWGRFDQGQVLRAQMGPEAVEPRDRAVADAVAWLRPFEGRGLKLVLEAPKPIFRAPAFRCVDRWTRHHDICRAGLVERRDTLEEYRFPVLTALRELAGGLESASIYDPLPDLCDTTTCSAIEASGRPLFFDADHISRYGNERLHAGFRRHLSDIGVAVSR